MICEKSIKRRHQGDKDWSDGHLYLAQREPVESGRVQFSTMKRLEDMDFERVETGEPLTIAYKRLR